MIISSLHLYSFILMPGCDLLLIFSISESAYRVLFRCCCKCTRRDCSELAYERSEKWGSLDLYRSITDMNFYRQFSFDKMTLHWAYL